jgi:hypothetical protein
MKDGRNENVTEENVALRGTVSSLPAELMA